MTVSWASVLGWRLTRHFLDGEGARSVAEVVDRLIAVPAWSGDVRTAIGLRLQRPDRGDVDSATARGDIFATYAFRGATHFMTPASAAVHLAIRCAGRQWERSTWREHYRLEPRDWPRLRATVRDALRDGPLSQNELAVAVAHDPAYRHLLPAFQDRSHTFLKPFGWQGDMCFSPSDDGPVFRLLESIPGWNGLEELDEAGPRAIRAYLSAYGPATRDRIHYWLGAGLSAGSKRIAGWIGSLADELDEVSIDGTEALLLAEHAEAISSAAESDRVVLLPGSDQWILGAGTFDTSIVPSEHRSDATRGANLAIVGGRVDGTWVTERETIRIRWFGQHRAPERSSIEAAVRPPFQRVEAGASYGVRLLR